MLEALYSSVHDSQIAAGPNLILSNGDTLVSGLSTPYPYITVEARSVDLVDMVNVVENIDNMLICDLRIPRQVEPAILSSYLTGVGILKIGYDSEFGWDPKYDVGPKKNPQGYSLTQFDKKERKIEFGGGPPGMPWVQYVDSSDFLIPWGVRELDNAEYCIHRVVRHIEDVRADDKYKNTSELQPTMSMEDFIRGYNTPLRMNRTGGSFKYSGDFRKPEYVELWEIHDQRTRKLKVIASGYDKFLRDDTDHLQVNGLPFVGFGLVPTKRAFWRTSDAYYQLQAQLELTDITIQASKLRRANVLKMLIQEGSIDEEELGKLTSARIAAYVKVKGDPRAAVAFTNPPPNSDIYQQGEMVRANSREMMGFSRNESGEFEPGGRRTAYEVARVAQGSDTRQNRRQSVIADLYTRLFEKINPICARFWTLPRLVKVLDQSSIPVWKAVNGSHLQGEYAYRTTFSNEGPVNRQMDRESAIQLLQFLSQDPLADPTMVRRFLVRSMNNPSFSAIYPQIALTGEAGNVPLQIPVSGGGSPGQAGGGGGPAAGLRPEQGNVLPEVPVQGG